MIHVLVIKCLASSAEKVSDNIWADISDVQGIEEGPLSGGSLFAISPEFEILEFGSEAAKRAADWLDREAYRGAGDILLRIYLGSVPESIEAVIASLKAASPGVEFVSFHPLPDRDYLAEYRKSVRGSPVGASLWVGPPWDAAPEGRISFVVDPGLAFGTGDHPTTQLCLQRLFELGTESGWRPRQTLDLGTGTGVLGLAARRFFRDNEASQGTQLTLTDLDPLCADEVSKTFALNKESLQGVQTFFGRQGTAAELLTRGFRFDLIVSNIYAEILAALAGDIARLLKPGGRWVASGILEGKSEDILLEAARPLFKRELRRAQIKPQTSLVPGVGLSATAETWVLLEFSKLV